MERIYYPSTKKFSNKYYLLSAIKVLVYWLILVVISFFQGSETLRLMTNVVPFVWFLIVIIEILTKGLRGEKLAIKITSTSVYAPLIVGRDMPILFSEMDFEKTLKEKKFCSIYNDELKFEEDLFDPEEVKEIWETIKKHEKKIIHEASL